MVGDEPGVGPRQRLGPKVVLRHPPEAAPPQGGHVLAHHGLEADVARLGDEHGADAGDQVFRPRARLAHVGELLREPRPAGHLENHLGEVGLGQQGTHGPTELDEAGRLVEAVEGRELQSRLAVLLHNRHGRIVGQARRRAPVGSVELVGQCPELDARIGRAAEGTAHVVSSRLPLGPRQELAARVGPSPARGDEHVAAAQRLPEAFDGAERVGAVVEVCGISLQDAQPRARHHRGGGVVPRRARTVGVLTTEEREGVQQGRPRLGSVERHVLEEQGQEPADGAVAGQEDRVPVVLRRLDDVGDRVKRGVELRLRQLVEEDAAQVDIRLGRRLAELHERVAQHQGGGIEVAQGPQPLPLRLAGRPSQQLADHQLERVQDVVESCGLERGGEGDEVGQAPLGAHAIERLGPGFGREPRQRLHAPLGNAGELDAAESERSHLLESVESGRDSRGGGSPGPLTQAVEAASAGAWRDDEELLERPVGRWLRRGRQGGPQAGGSVVVDRGNEALEHRRAREEDLVLEQPGDGEVEEHAPALAHCPRPCLQPLTELAVGGFLSKVPIPVRPADLRGVVPARLPVAIALEDRDVDDPELVGDVVDDDPGDVGGIGQERPQESQRAELHGEPKPRPLPGAAIHEGPVGVIEMEIAGELLGGRAVAEPPQALPSLLGQELDRHASPLRQRSTGEAGRP